ncbi:MAG: phenylalanine--tRNA ligase subunit beta [Candidatus Hadarchaeales archaeon]
MPTITIDWEDLLKLVGGRVGQNRIVNSMELLGLETEIDGNEVKVEVPHNRPDMLSVEGIARILKGILGKETGLPKYKVRESDVVVYIDKSTKDVRPMIAAGVALDVKLNEKAILSIMQLQEKLHESLGRKRRKASIGVYDLDTVKPPIHYTTTDPEGLRFVPLGFSEEMSPAEILEKHPKGIEYGHLLKGLPRYPVLIDSAGRVLSMPPIVNSEDTKVTKKTRRIFVDVTGLDWKTVHGALIIMLAALAERGYSIANVKIKNGRRTWTTPDFRPGQIRVHTKNVCETIGIDLKTSEIVEILRKMRYEIYRSGGVLEVFYPSYRLDIMHEIDVIEDVAIGYGYDKLEPVVPSVLTKGEEAQIEKISHWARLVMIGLGFTEVMTYTLSSKEKVCGKMCVEEELVEIGNPVSSEYSVIRSSLIPSLLEVLAENKHYPTPQKIFEIGNVAVLDPTYETRAKTVRRLAGAITGSEATFANIRAAAEAVMRELSFKWEIRETEHPSFISGRVVEILSDEKKRGITGEISPAVLEKFGLENPVAVFEIELGSI